MALPLASRLETAAVLVRRGMLRPVRPDRLLRAGLALHRWGSTHRGRLRGQRHTRPDRAAIIDDTRTLTYARSTGAPTHWRTPSPTPASVTGDKLAILCRNGAPSSRLVAAPSSAPTRCR